MGHMGQYLQQGLRDMEGSWKWLDCSAEVKVMEKLITDHLFSVLCIPWH